MAVRAPRGVELDHLSAIDWLSWLIDSSCTPTDSIQTVNVQDVTKRTRDGGYDMLLRREDPIIPLTHLVECKSTKKKNKVGIDVVERFLYKIDEMKVSSGVLVTNFEFSGAL